MKIRENLYPKVKRIRRERCLMGKGWRGKDEEKRKQEELKKEGLREGKGVMKNERYKNLTGKEKEKEI